MTQAWRRRALAIVAMSATLAALAPPVLARTAGPAALPADVYFTPSGVYLSDDHCMYLFVSEDPQGVPFVSQVGTRYCGDLAFGGATFNWSLSPGFDGGTGAPLSGSITGMPPSFAAIAGYDTVCTGQWSVTGTFAVSSSVTDTASGTTSTTMGGTVNVNWPAVAGCFSETVAAGTAELTAIWGSPMHPYM